LKKPIAKTCGIKNIRVYEDSLLNHLPRLVGQNLSEHLQSVDTRRVPALTQSYNVLSPHPMVRSYNPGWNFSSLDAFHERWTRNTKKLGRHRRRQLFRHRTNMHRSTTGRAFNYMNEESRKRLRNLKALVVDYDFQATNSVVFGVVDEFDRFVTKLVIDNDGII
jgi:hypothetical protein